MLTASVTAEAQPNDAHHATNTDSTRTRRLAMDAQRAFEAFRRSRLPEGPASSGRCEVRVGRYCYWRGDDDSEPGPPAEVAAIVERRNALIGTLANAASALPGDGWIAGQRVRYLAEANRADEAAQAADAECRATPVLCNSLSGYAAHIASRFAAADSAFRRAVDAMAPDERCRLFDVAELLTDELAERFNTLDCVSREAFARRLFRIGAPLYSVSETDLLTEYLTRRTRTRIVERAASTDGQSWGDDARALVVRYGWSRWYTRASPSPGSQRESSYTGHDVGLPYYFLPSRHALDSAGHATVDDWELEAARAPTGYAPVYARSIHRLTHQIASFRRGDSTLVVGAWDARDDSTLAGHALEAALVLAGDGGRSTVTRRSAGTVGTITVTGVVDSGLVSLELVAAEDRRAARARIGVPARAAGDIAVSGLMLHEPTPVPADFAAAVERALSSAVINVDRGVSVYWEVYGIPADRPVRYRLTLEEMPGGWLRRMAERVHLADSSRELRIEWEEMPRVVNGVGARDIQLNVGRLHKGRYLMQIAAGNAVSAREVELR